MYLKSSIRIWNLSLFSKILSCPNDLHLIFCKVSSVLPYSLVKSVAFPDLTSKKRARHTMARSTCKLMMNELNWTASVTSLSLCMISFFHLIMSWKARLFWTISNKIGVKLRRIVCKKNTNFPLREVGLKVQIPLEISWMLVLVNLDADVASVLLNRIPAKRMTKVAEL